MSDSPTPARTERSASTRNKIIQVAVRLFAERGIDGVSLNDINKAAGQRNKNATHYHFGSKEGLLQAILDKHEPSIAIRRNELLDQFEQAGAMDMRKVLRAVIQPLVEKLDDPDGGAEFVRFSSHLVVNQTLAAMHLGTPTFRIASVERIAHAIEGHLGDITPAVKIHRGILLGIILTHSLAEHTRLRKNAKGDDLEALTSLFVSNLEDCLSAMMLAPMSDDTRSQLSQMKFQLPS
ncbi:MAG: TetR/AcrR family transcriptional regulator [Oceanococcus sp.]